MAGESKQPQIAVAEAIHLLQMFRGADLKKTFYQIEKSLKGAFAESYSTVLTASGAKAEVLGAAGLVKQLAGQIKRGHSRAYGILLCLPVCCVSSHVPVELLCFPSCGAPNVQPLPSFLA